MAQLSLVEPPCKYKSTNGRDEQIAEAADESDWKAKSGGSGQMMFLRPPPVAPKQPHGGVRRLR